MNKRWIDKIELLFYTLIGGIATVIDWTVFAVAVNGFGLNYELALVCAYGAASLAHYSANKAITFKDESKDYASQLTIYLLVLAVSLGLSMAMMAILVKMFAINKVYLRIITTLLMLVPNYLLHKHITFNKKFFIQPAPSP